MYRTILLFAAITIANLSSAYSQDVRCIKALDQLKQYAVQVNKAYHYEYNMGIPDERCPLFNEEGRPVNVNYVYDCRIDLLTSLNQWYGEQSRMVNEWHREILKGCPVDGPSRQPAPKKTKGTEKHAGIQTVVLSSLIVNNDSGLVQVDIPAAPSAFSLR